MKKEDVIGKDTFVLLYTVGESTLIHASRLNDDSVTKHKDGKPLIIDLNTDDYYEAKKKYDDWLENP